VPRKSLSAFLLGAFAVIAVAHLVSLETGPSRLEWATKALLIPTLAAWAWTQRAPRLILVGLLLSAAGDITLQAANGGQTLFLVGMGFFAAAHVCYVTYFVRSGALATLRRRWWIPAAYIVVWLVLIVILWPDLGALQIPVAAYSLLLIATAITSAGLGPRTGLGGALFLVSDALLGAGKAGIDLFPHADLAIMATYIGAQYLIASGAVAHQAPSRSV
jgi:uncharacterized membrane protein YhhN